MITELTQEVGQTELVVEDGRTTIEDDGSGTVYLKQTEYTPLSQGEKRAELIVTTRNGKVEVALSSVDVDALGDAIHQIQKEDN